MDLGGLDTPEPHSPPPDYAGADRAAQEKNAEKRRRRILAGRGSTLLTSEEGAGPSNTGTRLLMGE